MRLLSRCAFIIVCAAVWGAWPQAGFAAPQVVVAGRRSACSPSPLLIDGELYVPLSFRFGGMPLVSDTDGEAVIVRGPNGTRARVPFVLRNDHMYYPLARACPDVGLRAQWVERLQKLFVAPSIQVQPPDLSGGLATLKVTSAYPVSYRVSALSNPTRLLIEVPNAHLATETANLPVGQAGVSQIRAAQYAYDPPMVRIVVDTQGFPSYRTPGGATTAICVRVGVPSALAPETRASLDRALNAPFPQDASRPGPVAQAPALPQAQPRANPPRSSNPIPLPASQAPLWPPHPAPAQTPVPAPAPPGGPILPPANPLVDLTGIGIETDANGGARLVIRAAGPVRGNVERLSNPPRLAIDIPDTAARAVAPIVPPGTPIVQGVRLGQYTERVTRIVVDLAAEAEYTLAQGPDPGTLILNIRSTLGMAPVRGIQGLRVMVDPGHGGSLHGTHGLTGRREQDVTLDVSKRLYALLGEAGARPMMTRFEDNTVGLYARPAMANAQKAQLFVSIHCNSNGRVNSARGIETFYCWPHSYPLACAIHRQVCRELNAPDRRVRKRPGLVVTRETKMPSILVEIGYMNHREEDRLLGTPEYRQRVAKAIFDGIVRYANGNNTELESASEETAPGSSDEGPDGTLDLSTVEQGQ